MRSRPLFVVALVLAAASAAWAQTPVEAARALVARYHEDLAGLDRARALLDAALAKDRRVDTMVMLSYVQLLVGDVRAATPEDKLAAYDRGREIGRRAVELAPKSHDAHLWYAINTARWGETKGVLRSLFLLPTIREELTILLELDPRSVRAHTLAGNVLLEVPGFAGGDRAKAEEHFKKAPGSIHASPTPGSISPASTLPTRATPTRGASCRKSSPRPNRQSSPTGP